MEDEIAKKDREIAELKAGELKLRQEIIELKSENFRKASKDLKAQKAVLSELQNK